MADCNEGYNELLAALDRSNEHFRRIYKRTADPIIEAECSAALAANEVTRAAIAQATGTAS